MTNAPFSRRFRRVLIAAALVTTTAVTSTVAVQSVSAAPAPVGSTTVPATTFVRGQRVTVTTTIPRAAGKARPTGTISFTVDGSDGPVVALNAVGKAVYSTNTIPVGGHQVLANYSGDANYSGGFAGTVFFEVAPGNTATTVTSYREPVPSGTNARINARTLAVAPAKASTTAGLTTFTATNGGAAVSAKVTTNSTGTALWRPLLADGTWTVTATFDGNDELNASPTSNTVTVHVGVPAPSTVDQEHWDTPDYQFSHIYQGTDTAQTFTAGRTGTLDRVDLALQDMSGGSAPPLTVTIRALDGNGVPTGSILGSATTTSAAAGGEGRDAIILSSPASVTAGTSYAINLATEDASYRWLVHYNGGAPYEGGIVYYGPAPYATFDLAFRTWVR